jgi:hypothetical protein
LTNKSRRPKAVKPSFQRPKSELFVICDYAMVDREGKLSVVGIFREMYADKMPSYIHHFYVAASILAEPESAHDITIDFTSPDGTKTIASQEVTLRVGIGGLTNLVTDIINLPLEQIGQYTISLHTNDGYLVGTNYFRVIDLKTPNPSVN